MNRIRPLLLAASVFGMLMPPTGQTKTEYLKEIPKDGEIPYGKVIYVDEKKCPKGEIKEVTGGSQEKAIPRKIRCVKRPREQAE